ncbi:DNA (cytosine-5-)-methyltransferase [Peptostreptococcus russellii]|uniref:DNA (cytosine-5-)-methyltransferase n=1 Tax=Peptostreptococcus russellii TaxID=215200 RepID=UPI003F5834A9
MELKVVELFAGVGGFRVGLNHIKEFNEKTGLAIENGDWDFVWANQWEPSTKTQPAYDCYIKRFGKENHSNVDINKVNKKEIKDHTLLVGGFPCQDYSVARSLSNEMGIKGKKGVLWWDIVDVLYEKRPPFMLLENVDRLLKSPASQRGRDFAVMLKTLDELGYIVQWRIVNAGEYGMPQRRRRVFIFASLKDTKYAQGVINKKDKEKYLKEDGFFNDIFPVETESVSMEEKSLEEFKDAVDVSNNYKYGKFLTSGLFINGKVINFDALEKYDKKIYTLGDVVLKAKKYQDLNLEDYVIEGQELEKWKYLKDSKRIERVSKSGHKYIFSEGSMSFPDSLDLPSRTMLTSESSVNRSTHIIYDEKLGKKRKITEVEAELLQMFPPNWTNTGMTKRQRYFMMGNALVTGVISKLELKLREIIIEENKRLK